MNSIKLADIKVGNIVSEDSFVLDNLFFLPQKTPLTEAYKKLLIRWNIEQIVSNGVVSEVKEEDAEKDAAENSSLDKKIGEAAPTDVKREEEIVSTIDDEFLNRYKNWIFMTMSFFTSIIKTKSIEKDKVTSFIIEIKAAMEKEKSQFLKIIGHDIEGIPYIYRKTLETMTLAALVSKNMNHNTYTSNNVLFATLFHDIGMVTIPMSVLNKKEPLTEEESTILKNHTVQGFKYLQAVGYSPLIATGALQHHERLDGKGYPNQARGDKISEVAKIIAVVDSYCASISQKPFKPVPIHAKVAIQELLKGSGTQYDAEIITHLIKNISFYPIGSNVVLSDDSIASVVDTSGVPMRPIVRINSTGKDLDLSKNANIFIKGVYVKKTN